MGHSHGLGRRPLIRLGIGSVGPLERGVRAGIGESLAGDQVAAGEVGDGERIAAAVIGEHELAL